MSTQLQSLREGDRLLIEGNRTLTVSPELAKAFKAGDRLAVVTDSEEILHLPASEVELAENAVESASAAFKILSAAPDVQIESFFRGFAGRLADPGIWEEIRSVNRGDVESARSRGRSTTRLIADETLRLGMIQGLEGWAACASQRDRVLEHVQQEDFVVDLVGAPLGVVAFVFEGRPNVLADACGVLRGGNTVVFRIGSDALATARAILGLALRPALLEAGLPEGCAVLLDSPSHACGWALFGDRRVSLAVARGSGAAVSTLGSLARSAGVPVSLHGTGGSWLMAGSSADRPELSAVVRRSLDRKVCNTLNTLCLLRSHARQQVRAVLEGLAAAAADQGQEYRLHVVSGSEGFIPAELLTKRVKVLRPTGEIEEMQADIIEVGALAREWEWERSPEISLVVVEDLEEAAELFNRYSPHFVASLLSHDESEHESFWRMVDAPFVGDAHTRWVDGQFALGRPELGLSNWQQGRLFGRGGVLSGDSVFTVRTRYRSRSG